MSQRHWQRVWCKSKQSCDNVQACFVPHQHFHLLWHRLTDSSASLCTEPVRRVFWSMSPKSSPSLPCTRNLYYGFKKSEHGKNKAAWLKPLVGTRLGVLQSALKSPARSIYRILFSFYFILKRPEQFVITPTCSFTLRSNMTNEFLENYWAFFIVIVCIDWLWLSSQASSLHQKLHSHAPVCVLYVAGGQHLREGQSCLFQCWITGLRLDPVGQLENSQHGVTGHVAVCECQFAFCH